MSELSDTPLSPTSTKAGSSKLPVLRKQTLANGQTSRQPKPSIQPAARPVAGSKTRAPSASPSTPTIAKRNVSSSSRTSNTVGSSSNKLAEPRGTGIRKVSSKAPVLPSTSEDKVSDVTPSTDPLKAVKDQRRATSIYVPAANPQKKASQSQLSSSAAARRASASQLPTLSSLNKKTSTSSLTRKPSNAQLSATSSATLSRKASSATLQTPTTVARKTSAPQLNKKVSNATLDLPTAYSNPPSSIRKIPSSGNTKSVTSSTSARTVPKAPARQPSSSIASRTTSKSSSRPATAASTAASTVASEESSPKKQSLRGAIAAARAAKAAATRKGSVTSSNDADGHDFNTDDPFNTGTLGATERTLRRKVQLARTEGRLNIANLELKEIPSQVYTMYNPTEDYEDTDDNGPKWYETVDLVKLVAADNDIVEVGEELAKMFGGLVALDMHSNMIATLPTNLAMLTQLTTLNLTNNKLRNDALEIICDITSLMDLRIARNAFEGDLTTAIGKLDKLEVLEIQENNLTSVPDCIEYLTRLKQLNVSHNSLEHFPFHKLRDSNMNELVISHNSLKGTLFGSGVDVLQTLQLFDIRSNRISQLCEGKVNMPALQTFLASNNELRTLPDMGEWAELLTLTVDYNRLEKLPEGMTKLPKLRVIDLTGNSFSSIDPTLGTMEALEVLKVEGNPLRERNLLSMSTADLKRTLKGRLLPPGVISVDGVIAQDEKSEEEEKVLELGPGGVLDLSKREMETVSRDMLEMVNPSPISIEAHHNLFPVIPPSFEMFTASLTSLNLSHSKLAGENYLPNKMSLRWLSTLCLANNSITTITPILKNLDAPKLEQLDIAANRVKDITGLRPTFPLLTRLYARDNVIEEIPVDSVDGMRILDLSGNAIGTLPPKLGLVMTLRELRVEGNCFRVPRWQILEKGTEAVLAWLRDKLPLDDTNTEDGFVSAMEE